MRKEGAYVSEEVLLEVFHVQVALCKGFDFLDCCSQVICRHLDGSLNTLGFDIVQKLLDLLQVLLSALLERLDVFRVRVLIINGGSLADHRVDSLVDVRQNFWSNVLDLGNDRSSVRLDRTFQSLDTWCESAWCLFLRELVKLGGRVRSEGPVLVEKTESLQLLWSGSVTGLVGLFRHRAFLLACFVFDFRVSLFFLRV